MKISLLSKFRAGINDKETDLELCHCKEYHATIRSWVDEAVRKHVDMEFGAFVKRSFLWLARRLGLSVLTVLPAL